MFSVTKPPKCKYLTGRQLIFMKTSLTDICFLYPMYPLLYGLRCFYFTKEKILIKM